MIDVCILKEFNFFQFFVSLENFIFVVSVLIL